MAADLLYSSYILDGVPMPLSPARMLRECTAQPPLEPDGDPETLADEHLDHNPDHFPFEESAIPEYAVAVEELRRTRTLPLPFSGPYSASKVAQALLDVVWYNGHFRLGDLTLKADWKWNQKEIGHAAAFYESVEATCNYIDALGVRLEKYSLTTGTPSVAFKAGTVLEEDDAQQEEEDLFRDTPYRTANPRLSRRRKAPATFQPEASDWIIYIPFDTCDYRLGGSTLAQAVGATPATPADVSDADYFMDCYEVLRELVEDGVVKAGVTVGDGGLMTALRALASGGTGADVSIREISKAHGEELPVRVLFSEVPGVVIQIADIDYDYVDAELILQDVVYFPIGHPTPGHPEVKLTNRIEIPQILESLLNTLEGED